MIREFIDAVKDAASGIHTIARVLLSIDKSLTKIANDGVFNRLVPTCMGCYNKLPCSKCNEPMVKP